MLRNITTVASGLLVVWIATQAWCAGTDPAPATLTQKFAANVAWVRDDPLRRVRSGGEDFSTATPIPSLPFIESDNTCLAIDDYSPNCAYDGNSAAPDLVYRFHADADVCVDVALCGSDFDNTLSVYENDINTLVRCNDDACGLNARIEGLTLTAGNDYFIIVDGWGTQCGDYQLRMTANPTVLGRAEYFAPGQRRIPGVEPCVKSGLLPPQCGAPSDSQGNFKVPGVSSGSVKLLASKVAGPADPSSIGGGDVLLLIQALAGFAVLTPDQEVAADVDGSGGQPNPTDLQQLRRYLVFDFAACARCGTWDLLVDSLGTYVPVPAGFGDIGCGPAEVRLKGIFWGDIDGSWPARSKTSTGSPGTLALGNAVWNGGECALPLTIGTGDVPSSSVMFSLRYDPNALEWVHAEPSAGCDLTVNYTNPGVLHGFLVGSHGGFLSLGAVAELRFRLLPGHEQTDIAFTRLLLNDQDAAVLPTMTISPNLDVTSIPRGCNVAAVPNPFNPTTRIEYTVPATEGTVQVSLRVVDLSGHIVRELVNSPLRPGRYTTVWNGADSHGHHAASGVYVLHLRAGAAVTSQKAVLVR